MNLLCIILCCYRECRSKIYSRPKLQFWSKHKKFVGTRVGSWEPSTKWHILWHHSWPTLRETIQYNTIMV